MPLRKQTLYCSGVNLAAYFGSTNLSIHERYLTRANFLPKCFYGDGGYGEGDGGGSGAAPLSG